MKSSHLILLSCFLIHIQAIVGNWWIVFASFDKLPYLLSMFQGVLYLSYPFIGLLTELLLNKFKVIQCSFVFYFLSSTSSLLISIFEMTYLARDIETTASSVLSDTSVVIVVILVLIGLGIYEANAIQFGMDQMQEASSQQLSSFIHWYYWCINVGGLVAYYVAVGAAYYVSKNCSITSGHLRYFAIYSLGLFTLFSSIIQIPLSSFGIISCFCYARNHHIEHTSRKPLRMIYQVLQYAYRHKYPERRSAFTYWENDMPSRIDLGKDKYGGPFTYEQVEDVKTVLRLLLVIFSLYGLQISGDGYSVILYTIQTTGCPTFFEVMALLVNPQHLTFIVAIVGIPFMKLLKTVAKYHINLGMLQQIKIGLTIGLANEAVQCLYSAALTTIIGNDEFNCPEVAYFNKSKVPILLQCASANAMMIIGNSCQHLCSSPPTHNTIYLLLLIFFLQGVSHLLVFATMLEFICAQCPNETKGLLIGVWYAMLSLKSFCINITDTQIPMDLFSWNIYHGIKGVGIFSSIVIFSFVSKFYRNRERNEVVNNQAIIEEQYERELLMNPSYENTERDFGTFN